VCVLSPFGPEALEHLHVQAPIVSDKEGDVNEKFEHISFCIRKSMGKIRWVYLDKHTPPPRGGFVFAATIRKAFLECL